LPGHDTPYIYLHPGGEEPGIIGGIMKRIAFNPRFINEAGNDLIPSKIHTIRKNYDYWKKFEGKEVALFTWEDRPYRSKQKVFCMKRIVSVQKVELKYKNGMQKWFEIDGIDITEPISVNEGFWHKPSRNLIMSWFLNNNPGKMAILHFTNFKY
jgi:hypothetical protein